MCSTNASAGTGALTEFEKFVPLEGSAPASSTPIRAAAECAPQGKKEEEEEEEEEWAERKTVCY
jgi:hypothetical protein